MALNFVSTIGCDTISCGSYQVDAITSHVILNYDYKVAGAEDLISDLIRGIEKALAVVNNNREKI